MTSSTTPTIPFMRESVSPARTPQPGLLVPSLSLCRRELVRFLRQRSRIIGALLTPIVFWAGIGAGMGRSFRPPGAGGNVNFLEFFFPGTILMILLFTAIFSTISIIEDRREGFLQSVLVAPVPRMAIVLGKVLGGTVLAFGSAAVFLLLAPTVGIRPSITGLALAAVMTAVVAFSLTALGFCIAWRMNSTQGFHAIMNLFLMPLWFLSGALFPPEGAMPAVRWVMRANPLSYGLTGLREAIYWGHSNGGGDGGANPAPGFGVCLIVSVAFAASLFLLASAIARSRATGDFE
jgi:ABC-2 type transport system permease protein